MDVFIGKWRADLSRFEGVEAYVEAGLSPKDITETILANGYTYEITKSGNVYTVVMSCPGIPTITNSFEMGKETTLEGIGGIKVKGIIKAEGNKVTEHAKTESGIAIDIVRELVNGEMKAVTTSFAGAMTQYFKRC